MAKFETWIWADNKYTAGMSLLACHLCYSKGFLSEVLCILYISLSVISQQDCSHMDRVDSSSVSFSCCVFVCVVCILRMPSDRDGTCLGMLVCNVSSNVRCETGVWLHSWNAFVCVCAKWHMILVWGEEAKAAVTLPLVPFQSLL